MATSITTIKPADEVKQTLLAQKQKFRDMLPKHIDADKFVLIATTAINMSAAKGQDLLDCNRASLYAACAEAAQAGLLPDGREAAFVKFKDQVKFMPMVEGLMKQVRNSGEITNISVQVVKENDFFEYELGDNERMVHKPALRDRGETIGSYSIVTLASGEKSREWMDVADLERISKRSRSQSGPWQTDTDEMCRKTVFRRHYKRLPKSTDKVDELISKEDEADTIPEAIGNNDLLDGIVPKPAPERNRVLQAVVDSAKPAEATVVVDTIPANDSAAAF